jgi:hypothetical protein
MDEAREKAEKLLGKITRTEEEKDCYIFYNDEMEFDGVLVVLKKNNRIMSMTEYVAKQIGRK